MPLIGSRRGKEEKHPWNWALGAAVLILLGATLYVLLTSRTDSLDTGAIAGDFSKYPGRPSTHQAGRAEMVIFFDFYCPHCYTLHKELPGLRATYRDQLIVREVGYPLRESSIPPLEAYELAKDAGKGEAMADALFSAVHDEGRVLDEARLVDIAKGLGMDGARFREDLRSRKVLAKVRADTALGDSYSLRQTPTVVLDGQLVTTNYGPSNLGRIIDSILKIK